jgi:AcrR family transcriptional regulator
MSEKHPTKRRLLDAATAEFAAFGIAGARVDRIAATAGVNKAQMYAYYGSKSGLFDAVFQEHNEAILDAVPFTADDLPGYAARLYDAYVNDPKLVRLATWNRLERIQVGNLLADLAVLTAKKYEAIAEAQRVGQLDPAISPADVYSLVIALSLTWGPSSVTYAASHEDSEADHAYRRAVIEKIVARAFAYPAHDET